MDFLHQDIRTEGQTWQSEWVPLGVFFRKFQKQRLISIIQVTMRCVAF